VDGRDGNVKVQGVCCANAGECFVFSVVIWRVEVHDNSTNELIALVLRAVFKDLTNAHMLSL
jgi:hypothetical protein